MSVYVEKVAARTLEIAVFRSDSQRSCAPSAAHYELCRADRQACADFSVAMARHPLSQSCFSAVAAEVEQSIPRLAGTLALAPAGRFAGSQDDGTAIDLHVRHLV